MNPTSLFLQNLARWVILIAAAVAAMSPVCAQLPAPKARLVEPAISFHPTDRRIGVRCPLFLFHADDDNRVAPAGVIAFRGRVAQTNPHVTDSSVSTGAHYRSALDQRTPRSIVWLKALPKP